MCFYFLLWHYGLLSFKTSPKIPYLIHQTKQIIVLILQGQKRCHHKSVAVIILKRSDWLICGKYGEKIKSHHWNVCLSILSHMTTAVVGSQSQPLRSKQRTIEFKNWAKWCFSMNSLSALFEDTYCTIERLHNLKIAGIPRKCVFTLGNLCDYSLRMGTVLYPMLLLWLTVVPIHFKYKNRNCRRDYNNNS